MYIPVINRFFQWFKVGLITPVLVLMMLSKGASLEWVGIVSVVMSVCVILFEIPSGVCSDLFGRQKIYLLALSFELISITTLFFSDSMIGIVIGFGIYGIGRAFSSGSIESLYIDHFIHHHGKEKLHRLITAMNVGEASGLAVGALCGGLIPEIWKQINPEANLYNGNLVVQFLTICFLIMMTLFTPYKDKAEEKAPLQQMLKESVAFMSGNTVMKGLLFGTFVWGFVFNAIEMYWQPNLKALLENDTTTTIFGIVNSSYFIASILGSVIIGVILNRTNISSYKVMSLLRIFLGISIVLMSLQNGLIGFTCFFLLIMGFNGMLNVPENTAINLQVPEGKRASMLSMGSFLMQMGGAFGALLYSILLNKTSIHTVWILAGCVFALSSIIYLHIEKVTMKKSSG